MSYRLTHDIPLRTVEAHDCPGKPPCLVCDNLPPPACSLCFAEGDQLEAQSCEERLMGIASLAFARHDALQAEHRRASIAVDEVVKLLAKARRVPFLRRETVRIDLMARAASSSLILPTDRQVKP